MSGRRTLYQVILIFIAAFGFLKSSAQLALPAKYEVGLNVGAYVYQGDLAPRVWGSLKTTRPGLGVHIGRIISPAFTVRAGFNIATLRGDETKFKNPPFRKFRAFKFTGTLREVNLQGTWNFLGSGEFERTLQPYVFAGIGAGFVNTDTDYSEFVPEYFGGSSRTVAGLAIDITKPARKTIPVVPIGLGFRYNLTADLTLNLETTYRLTNTDYIDGFSQSANPSLNDHYLSQTVGISYKFGRKSKFDCPMVLNF